WPPAARRWAAVNEYATCFAVLAMNDLGGSMRYVLKQKLLSWGDDFTIKDEAEQDRFFVDGKAVSLGDKLSFQDMQHNELVFIRQKLLSIGNTYEIYRKGVLFAVVKEKWLPLTGH